MQSCPEGTYTDRTGANSVAACLPAPAGNYAAGTGNDGFTPCEPGTYQDQPGKGACKVWELGRLGWEDRCIACPTCPHGVGPIHDPQLASSLSVTPAQAHYASSFPALFCRTARQAASALPAPLHLLPAVPAFMRMASSPSARCAGCPWAVCCLRTQTAMCSSGCAGAAALCSSCHSCCNLQGLPAARTPMQECPKGTYQDKPAQRACKPCPAGSYCGASKMSAPTKCPAGRFGTKLSSVSPNDCLACPINVGGGASNALSANERFQH